MKRDPDLRGYLVAHVSRRLNARLNRKFQNAGDNVTTEQWKILCL